MITRPSILRFCAYLGFATLVGPPVHAGSSTESETYQGTEAVLLTPWPVFNRSLESLASPRKSFQEKAQNVIWNVGPLRLNVSSVEVTGETGFDSTSPALQQLGLTTKNLSLTVVVDNVSIKQVIDYPINGGTLHLHIDTDCGPFTLKQDAAKGSALIAFAFKGADVTTEIKDFAMQWDPQTWELANFTCHGPSDMPDTVRREIMSRLQNAEALRPLVESTINKRMQEQVNEAVQSARFPRLLPTETGLQPITVEFTDSTANEKDLLSHARFTWSTASAAKAPPRHRHFGFDGVPKNFAPDQVSMIFPEKGLNDLVNAQLQAQPKILPFDLQQQPDFKDIWNHPLKLAFGWPDLLNYTAASPFELDLQRPDALELRWQTNGVVSSTFPVQGVVRSVRDQKTWDYIPLRAQTQATAATQLHAGQLQIVLNPVVSQLQAQYGADYVSTYHPNPKIPIDVVQNFLNTSLKDLSYQIELPALDLREAGVARASGLNPDGAGLIIVPFDITPAGTTPPVGAPAPSRKVEPPATPPQPPPARRWRWW